MPIDLGISIPCSKRDALPNSNDLSFPHSADNMTRAMRYRPDGGDDPFPSTSYGGKMKRPIDWADQWTSDRTTSASSAQSSRPEPSGEKDEHSKSCLPVDVGGFQCHGSVYRQRPDRCT